ncbi:hypothetical protein PM082_019904 [Marasmius tenuissimus]|nr:hypothetical protein PM082_019904 [Marasmius tenuissimus]
MPPLRALTSRQKPIRAPANLLSGHVDGHTRSSIRSFSQNQQAQRKTAVEKRLKQMRKQAARNNMGFLDLIDHERYNTTNNDSFNEEDMAESTSSNSFNVDDSTIPMNAAPEDDGDWEDEDKETEGERIEREAFQEATRSYWSSYYKDTRTRRDKIKLDSTRWEAQIEEMAEAYMDYCYRKTTGASYSAEVVDFESVVVRDVFYNSNVNIPRYTTDTYRSSSLIRQGYFPCNPLIHKSAITTRMLELYYYLFVRCPRQTIQPFIRAICDLHGIRFQHYLCVQFSSSFDAFIAVKNRIRKKVKVFLRRDQPDWRSLNACPACQYPVEGEKQLEIEFLGAMDGNDSLKRVERRETTGENGGPGRLKEREDPREGGREYFLSREEVDWWERDNWPNHKDWEPPPPGNGEKKNGCEERWSNMKDAHTEHEKVMYDETGVFVSTCRHMFVLWIADMVKSGEGRKLALAILSRYLNACKKEREEYSLPDPSGSKGFGYDIGCGFNATVEKSPLKELAVEEKLKILIGLMHGHAHNRRCQLLYLMIYIFAAGIEDLEVLERLFSQSNALTSATRHASRFHRRQMIEEWMYHHDNFESYANLSKFIYNNYAQVLEILAEKEKIFKEMEEIGVEKPSDVLGWLAEEREYLDSRQDTPEEDEAIIELFRKLVSLKSCQERLASSRTVFLQYKPGDKDETARLERSMRQDNELETKLMAEVHVLEHKLNIKDRWTEDSEEWDKAAEMSKNQDYQKAIDRLEALVVARIFELSKMHLASTGYKMRQHLGKALKTRSAAIKTAVDNFNKAAVSLGKDTLSYDTVIEKTYLSELDFLRETRDDVRTKKWAQPANRTLVTKYCKIWGAHYELDRLHVEIKRLVTYMKEERNFLRAAEAYLEQSDPALAHQIALYRWERGRFQAWHRMRLRRIYKLPGFDPAYLQYFSPGRGLKRSALPREWEESEEIGDDLAEPEQAMPRDNDDDDDGDEDEDDAEGRELVGKVLRVAHDR